MGAFARFVSSVVDDRRAATAIEYALLGSLVAVGCIAALLAFADSRDGMWTRMAELLVAAMGGGP